MRLTTSAQAMYRATIAAVRKRYVKGNGVSPRRAAKGTYGKATVISATPSVARTRRRLGLLLKTGWRLRTTRRISEADTTDSRNHAVRNWSVPAWKRYSRAPNVR